MPEPNIGEKDPSLTVSPSTSESEPYILQPHGRIAKFFLGSKPKPIPTHRTEMPRGRVNFLNVLSFWWVGTLMRTGYDRYLEINDIWTMDENGRMEKRSAEYHRKLAEYKERKLRRPHLYAIAFALRWEFLINIIQFGIYATAEVSLSVISRPTIESISNIYSGTSTDHGHAVGFAVGNLIVNVCFMFCFVWFQYGSRQYAETVRSVFIAAIYDKVLNLSPRGRADFPASAITALITTDTNRIYMASRWTGPALCFLPAIGAIVGILISNIGVSALPGFGLVLVGVCANIYLSRFILKYRRRSIPFADQRIGAVRETIENMRIIKFYGWEDSFVKLISAKRKVEAALLKKLGIVTGIIDASTTSMPLFGGMLSFSVLSIIGNLESSRIFPSLTLFTIFIPLSMFFSQGVNSHMDALSSIQRLQLLFDADEDAHYVEQPADATDIAINIENGSFEWKAGTAPPTKQIRRTRDRLRQFLRLRNKSAFSGTTGNTELVDDVASYLEKEEEEELEKNAVRAGSQKFPGLKHINMKIHKNELIMVVGAIGSGKSSLLSVIAGNMSKKAGNVIIDGQVTPIMSNWSLNGTIRDNILFGHPYESTKYSEVTHVCNLESDFSAFDGRDFAEIGERGITLSGGQKARVALARGIYNGGDIILLDDVLSAVDSKVGKQIFEKCILGYLKHTTRIMATHNLKQLPSADRIIYLDGYGNAAIGTLKDLLDTDDSFRRMYVDKSNPTNQDESDTEAESESKDEEFETETVIAKLPTIEPEKLRRQDTNPPDEVGKLMTAEQRNRGTVAGQVCYTYLKLGSKMGVWFVLIICFFQACVGTASVMQTVFLNWWSSDRYDKSNGFYIGFYGLILAGRLISYAGLVFSIATFCFNSSSNLHNAALANIYRAPMSYFDSTPLGRIINRFTDDTANLDTLLFMQLRMFMFSTSMLLGSLIVIFVYVPWAILCLAPVVVFVIVFMSYFRVSSREIKRINSLFRSKMFSHLTETVSGLSVIIGYHRADYFRKVLYNRIDDMNSSVCILLSAQYWLSLRVILSTAPVNFVVTMLCVYQVFDLNPSSVGMLLSLIPNVCISLAMTVPMFTELENQMNSIERIYELAHDIPHEAAYANAATQPPTDWPQKGSITYKNVCLRYRPNLPLALNDVNLDVKGSEKIGICGRTGSGKSTILASLFRITELSAGNIYIDDVDISTIGLRDLRSKLAIIPQDPVLFQGTIRFNLDPFGEYTDVQLWDALRRSGAVRSNEIKGTEVVATHKFHLDSDVEGDGANFSLGERQLLTLARALVRQPKILVLDEATASVDLKTDNEIQETIVREFSQCTILCIAHRLQTILHYDRIVIMELGQVVETGNPRTLWEDHTSIFRSMCDEANITSSNFDTFQV